MHDHHLLDRRGCLHFHLPLGGDCAPCLTPLPPPVCRSQMLGDMDCVLAHRPLLMHKCWGIEHFLNKNLFIGIRPTVLCPSKECYATLNCTMRAILYCTILYCTVLYCTILYCTVLYCTAPYWIVHHIISCYIVLKCDNRFVKVWTTSLKDPTLFSAVQRIQEMTSASSQFRTETAGNAVKKARCVKMHCVVQAGYGMTDPDPLWHPRGLSMFDVGRLSQMDNQEVVPRVAKVLGNHLMAAAGGCRTGLCKVSNVDPRSHASPHSCTAPLRLLTYEAQKDTGYGRWPRMLPCFRSSNVWTAVIFTIKKDACMQCDPD
jgi:hypothetical protein